MLSEAKHLSGAQETLRFAQGDRKGSRAMLSEAKHLSGV